MELIKNSKNSNILHCNKCDFTCSNKNDMSRHLLRRKHILNADGIKMELKKTQKTHYCNCGKKYNTQSGFWKHQQKCINQINNKIPTDNIIINNTSSTENEELKKIVLDIVKSNHELQKQNVELQQQVLEICKNIQPSFINTYNQTNCNNKTFNLQVFLNETCKDAMNLSEFIENISLQLSDLENIGTLGYVEGVSNIIIKNLNALEVEKRPMHCTDKKREIMYVKDDDEWQKEQEDKKRIKSVISCIVSKNLQLLSDYENKYPECMNPESKKSDEYNKIIMETMGGGMNVGEKNKEKIIRKIAKEIVIDKE